MDELKAATLDTVRKEIVENLRAAHAASAQNREWPPYEEPSAHIIDAELELLRREAAVTHWENYRAVAGELRRDAITALRLLKRLQAMPEREGRDPRPFEELIACSKQPAVVRLVEQLRYFQLAEPHKLSSRAFIADPLYWRGPKWWWLHDKRNPEAHPSNRDRALISLWAGNFPSPSKSWRKLTVEEVIQLEMEAIASSRKRISAKRQPKRSATTNRRDGKGSRR